MNMLGLAALVTGSRALGNELLHDRRGLAAVEFAIILPIVLVLFFGTVEFSSGISEYRKVTLVAHTLSDLTSQTTTSVTDVGLSNYFAASSSIVTPYDVTPIKPTISELYVDNNKVAKVQWSKSATVTMSSGSPQVALQTSGHNVGDVVAIPATLATPGTFLIWSEVSYVYTPSVGYVMGKTGISLKDQSYTRPRFTTCVDYPQANSCALH